MRTLRLRPGESFTLDAPCSLTCCAGSAWIEPPGTLLIAGDRRMVDRSARVRGYEGMKDEWLNDTGVVVLALEDACPAMPA